MEWLGELLGYRKWEDWYRVSAEDLERNKGSVLLVEYDSCLSDIVKRCFPEHDWKEWLFERTPKGFWHHRKNRMRCLEWLGERLGYKQPGDWYRITQHDCVANGGRRLLRYYNSSPIVMLKDLFPRVQWKEWMFYRVPDGFWDDSENRKRYVRWLGKRLGYRRGEDWYQIRKDDFQNHCGGALAGRYRSHLDLLEECLPELDWDSMRRGPLAEQQIIAWAKAHHRRTGKWPKTTGGLIEGANRDT